MIILSCERAGKFNDHTIRDEHEVKARVEAYVHEGLALHKDLTDQSLYVLTHIKSGMIISRHKMNKSQAMQWLVNSAALIDWTEKVSFTSSYIAQQILEIALTARRISGSIVD